MTIAALARNRTVAFRVHMGGVIVGTLPGAFQHPSLGLVDAHVRYRSL
jgi:hypothetical protein